MMSGYYFSSSGTISILLELPILALDSACGLPRRGTVGFLSPRCDADHDAKKWPAHDLRHRRVLTRAGMRLGPVPRRDHPGQLIIGGANVPVIRPRPPHRPATPAPRSR